MKPPFADQFELLLFSEFGDLTAALYVRLGLIGLKFMSIGQAVYASVGRIIDPKIAR